MAYFECTVGGGEDLTLTVSCTQALAGEVITLTNGVETLTALCPSVSPYEVFFEIPEAGTWTVSSGTYSETYEITPNYTAQLGFIHISCTIYSAANDTVIFNDADGAKAVVTDSTGKAENVEITLGGLSETITFTSMIAKDPLNLSNAYTKTLAVTNTTTEIYVMPDFDIMLYWYGYNPVTLHEAKSGNVTITDNTNDINIKTLTASSSVYAWKYTDSITNVTNHNKFKAIFKSSVTTGGFQINGQNPFNATNNSNIVIAFGTNDIQANAVTYKELNLPNDSKSGSIRIGTWYDTVDGTLYALWID